MASISEQVFRQTIIDYPVREGDPNNTNNALKQIDAYVSWATSEGNMEEKDALKTFLGSLQAAAVANNKNYQEIYDNYPPEVKARLLYTPADLELNQDITILGIKIQLGAQVGYLLGLAVSTVLTGLLKSKLPPWMRVPQVLIASYGITAFFAAFSQTVGTIVNNWNDVMHWGPLILQGQLQDLEKQQNKLGGSGNSYQTPKTRTTTYKTAKPKLFLGVLYAGQVGKYEQFVRQVDDSITSEEDLRNDVQINLVKYISTIDNNLSYAIQIKNSPSDEYGVPRTGTWATLSIYFTNQFHKRLFLDEILLGPIDPFVYYPETQVVQSIQHEVPKLVDFDNVKVGSVMPDKLSIVDTAGNKIADVVPGSGPATPPVAPSGNPAKFIGNSGKEYTGVLDAQGNFIPWPTPNIGSPEDIEIKSRSGRILQTPGGVATSTPSSTPIPSPYVVQPVTNPTPEPAGAFSGALPAQPEHVRLDFPREVTVAVDVLNVRSAPNTWSPLAGSQKLYRGDRFTVVEAVNGEVVSGTNNGRWWKSSLGNYVWSGGTTG